MHEALTVPFVTVVTSLVVALACLFAVRRMVLPTSHLLAGRYTEARAAAEHLARGVLRFVPGLRVAGLYTAASADHLAGRLEGSLAVLRGLHEADLQGNMRYAARSLEAANLVLLDRDHARALAAITEARALQDSPEDLLFTAHALASLGRPHEADAHFARAGETPSVGRLGMGRGTGPIKLAMFHYLRGAYLARSAKGDRGKKDFTIAAESRTPSVYATRARKALDGRAPAPSQVDEPPSSLSPLVSSLLADHVASRRSKPDP